MALISKIDPKDGVITLFYRATDGREADIADFYVKPLMDGLSMSRMDATQWQQQFAGMLIEAYQRHFTPPGAVDKAFPEIV